MLKKIVMKNGICTGVFCVLAVIISFAIYNMTHVLLTHFGVEQRLGGTVGRFLACIAILIIYNQIMDIKTLGMQKENFLKGLLTGGFLFFVLVANVFGSLNELSEYPVIMPALSLILIIIVEQIFVGIFEEFLFRGLVLNTILAKMKGDSFKNKIIAILLSSVLFGVIHFLNLFDTPELMNATIQQVCFAAFTGVFLGALYLRTNNIWVVAFYHTLTNIAGEMPAIFYDIPEAVVTEAATDVTVAAAVENIAMNLIFVVVGLFLARKLRPSISAPQENP